MNKKILYLIILVFLIDNVFSMRTCQDVIEANTNCEIITPVIDCNTYDLYNSTHDLAIDDGIMSEIGDTGTYNFTFNQPDSGTHKIITCANDTATIEVADYSLSNIYIEAQNDTAISDTNSTEIAYAVWDVDLSERYSSADDDNYIATLAGEQFVQALRFIIQLLFG